MSVDYSYDYVKEDVEYDSHCHIQEIWLHPQSLYTHHIKQNINRRYTCLF